MSRSWFWAKVSVVTTLVLSVRMLCGAVGLSFLCLIPKFCNPGTKEPSLAERQGKTLQVVLIHSCQAVTLSHCHTVTLSTSPSYTCFLESNFFGHFFKRLRFTRCKKKNDSELWSGLAAAAAAAAAAAVKRMNTNIHVWLRTASPPWPQGDPGGGVSSEFREDTLNSNKDPLFFIYTWRWNHQA